MNYSKGISWFDDCRIPFVNIDIPKGGYGKATIGYGNKYEYNGGAGETKSEGRFPANLLCSDDVLNDGVISQGNKTFRIQKSSRRYGENNFTNGGLFTPEGHITPTYNDKGTNSRYYDIDKWFDKILNEL